MFASGPKALVAAIGVVVLAGCSAQSTDSTDVKVGAGDSAESRLLAQIYAGAIRSAGTAVEVESGLGGRADYLESLDRGDITLIPDFTGALLSEFDSTSRATESEDVFVDLNRSLPEGLTVGDYALAEDRTAIAVSPAGPFADASSLSDVESDLYGRRMGVLGNPPKPDPQEVVARLEPGIGDGFTDVVLYLDARTAVDALASGEIDVLAFTTVSFGPEAADLVTLEDTESVFPAQNVVPLLRNGSLNDTALATLSVVAGELTTADLADMIGEVRSGGDSGDVAARWLGEHNL
ncbi:glycine betaine ABC transporter substrate-binding protein [Rhodococcus sp. G-MC3]|uniref:glycine betaine ABC transporter substrate-binding protein n=1 Tax=Rhodococcus sp. G-MC3 TaxID=3046209 RepID=UPI0024B884D7|nr:glycine betaine ABC transporter substrate-binding protein [Rhodococcus sp. G-MC3]MDJ0392371.1 glycine betaine ABC transporter substrate-binding protein [Rhodococcus sp. G-MC3]